MAASDTAISAGCAFSVSVSVSSGPSNMMLREVLAQRRVDLIEHGPRRGMRLGELRAHADGLAALPWKYERDGHCRLDRVVDPRRGLSHRATRPVKACATSRLGCSPLQRTTTEHAAICACCRWQYAYKTRFTRSGRRLNGRSPHEKSWGRAMRPGCRCFRSFGSLGLSVRRLPHRGPKGALRRTGKTKERQQRATLRACLPGAPGYFAGAGRCPDQGIERGHHRGRRQDRQGRVLGRQAPRLQDQEEPQGALLADEHRRAAGGGGRDGAAHAALPGRDPVPHRARRCARDRAFHPDAQERPRRPARRRPRRRRAASAAASAAAAAAASAAVAAASAATAAASAAAAAARAATARAAMATAPRGAARRASASSATPQPQPQPETEETS